MTNGVVSATNNANLSGVNGAQTNTPSKQMIQNESNQPEKVVGATTSDIVGQTAAA